MSSDNRELKRELARRRVRQIVVDIAVLAGIGIVLGFLAPLGTGYMSLAGRIGYWVTLAIAGYAFYKPIGWFVIERGPALDLPEWFLWTISVMLASIPMAMLVWIVNAIGGTLRMPGFDVAMAHYFAVCVVGAVITVIFYLLPATRTPEAATTTDDAVAPPGHAEPVKSTLTQSDQAQPDSAQPNHAQADPPRFLDRLPAELGSELIALEMEDHYVRAHTALGDDLVLMRMRDAVAELRDMDGLQVHRSWWVARGAVVDVLRDRRNIRLKLDKGLEAPVSRANVSVLKEAGWL